MLHPVHLFCTLVSHFYQSGHSEVTVSQSVDCQAVRLLESCLWEVDGASPEWLCCGCVTITGRLRIAQALDEEMSADEQGQQPPPHPPQHSHSAPGGSRWHMPKAISGLQEGNCPLRSSKMTNVGRKASTVVTSALLSMLIVNGFSGAHWSPSV